MKWLLGVASYAAISKCELYNFQVAVAVLCSLIDQSSPSKMYAAYFESLSIKTHGIFGKTLNVMITVLSLHHRTLTLI